RSARPSRRPSVPTRRSSDLPVLLRDLFPRPPEPGTVPSCAEAGVIGSLCGIAGSIMATEAIKLITGMGDVLLGRVAVVDALSMRIHEVPLTPDASDADDDAPAASADAGPLPPAAGDHGPLGEGTAPSLPRTMLDVEAFEQRRAHAGGSPVVLVDVREPGEAGQNRLPGAVNLPISV